MSSRFEVSDEPAFSNSYNWRSSAKLKLDEPDEVNAAQRSIGKREMSHSIRAKSPVTFSNSSSLARSVDLFSPTNGYDVNSNGNEMLNGRTKSPGFTSTGNHVLAKSLSREDTSSGGRKTNNELTRSIDLGSYAFQPSSSYSTYDKSRPKTAATAVASKGDDRLKNRPPVAPGRPRPQPSDTLPRSGTPATYSTAAYSRTGDAERKNSLSNDKRTLHSSINSLDNLRHADHQQLYDTHGTVRTSSTNLYDKHSTVPTSSTNLYDKHSTVRTSSTNFHLDRPWSRSSDVGPIRQDPSGYGLDAPEERNASANAHKSLLLESRSKSALAGSLSRLERSGTSANARSYADTPGFETRDKSSSLRHSTDMNLGASYDEIIKRLRKMETQTDSGNLRMKPDIATDHKAVVSESVPHRSSDYLTSDVFRKKPTDDKYSNKRATDEFSNTDDFKDSSMYNRNSATAKDKFQYKNGGHPRTTGDTTTPSDTFKTYPDLSSRTGERTSAYSKNGAIESWLRSVTTESSDTITESLHGGDKNAFQDSSFSHGGDHTEYNESAKQKRSTKTYDLSNGYDENVRSQRSRKLSDDSYQKATSPIKQSLVKKGSIAFTNSTYNVDADMVTPATRRGFDSGLVLAKQDRDRKDLSSYDPNTRSDSRLSLLRKYLDQADSVGTQAVSSAVDNGYLKLPDELGKDDLRRSTSSFDHRSSNHLDGSSFRKMSADLSYLGNNSPKPVYTSMTLTRTPSTEAFSNRDPYSSISLSRDNLDSYQTTSSKSKRHEDPTLGSERQFENSKKYSFNALTSSVERPRSPTRNFSETKTDKRYDTFGRNSEQTRLESERETDNSHTTTTSIYNKKKPSYSSTEHDWMSTSYGKSDLSDDGKSEKKKRDAIDFQLTGGYADSRTLLKILEKNRKHRTASSADPNENSEVKYTSRTTADLVNANSEVATTRDLTSRSSMDQTRIEDELGKVRSSSDYSSIGQPKRVWYSEEHLAPSTNDADNDISVRFDYKPDTFRYVLRKDTLESALDMNPISNGDQDSSARVRRWRSDLALFGDNLESKEPSATSFDSRKSGLNVMRSSSFRDTKEVKTPERRQVKWQDEVLFNKASGESSIAMKSNYDALQGNVFLRKERDASPSSMPFTPLSDRLRLTERNGIVPEYSTGLVESQSSYQGLRSQSPSFSKSFLASTWSASDREKDVQESKLKHTVNGVDPNPTSLYESSSSHRPSSSLYENLRSLSPSFKSKSFLASTASGRDEDRETKLKHTVNGGDQNSTSLYESSSSHRPSSSLYENGRSQSPSFKSKSYLASTVGDSNPASLHENPSNYRPSYRPSSRLSSASYTLTDQDPLTTTKPSNASLNDTYTLRSTTTPSKTPTIDQSTYNHHTPIDDGVTTKTSTYLSTDSIYTSSYSPTRYTSTSLPNHADAHSDSIADNYATQNSVLKAQRGGRTSSPYQEIENFLSSRPARKSTNDMKQPDDDVLQGKWRPTTSNGGDSSSGVSNNYRHLLSSSNYADSTYKDSNHLVSVSVPDSSAMSSRRGSLTSSKPHRGDASVPLKLATNYPHDTGHLTSSLLSSKDTAAKDNSSAGLPYKYLSYHVAPSSNGSSANTYGQSSTRLSDSYSGIGHRERIPSSGSASRDDLRHLRSNSLTNGVSHGTNFLSGMSDKHDDGMSLVSETEFVVMRSGDIVKRPFKKSDRSDAQIQSRYSKPHSSARNTFR